MKGVEIEYFTLSIAFRKVISFIHKKINSSNRVPLRGFLTQHFIWRSIFYPKFFVPQICFRPKRILDPIFFSGQKFFWTQYFWGPTFFSDPKYFLTQIFFGRNIFGPNIFSDPKYFSDPKFFSDPNFFQN